MNADGITRREIRIQAVSEDVLTIHFRSDSTPARMAWLSIGIKEFFGEIIQDTVCGIDSLLIQYNPLRMHWSEIRAQLESLIGDKISETAATTSIPGKLIEIPACYDVSLASDLPEMAEKLQIPVSQIIELHSGKLYDVQAIGFSPGFAYLGNVDDRIVFPRRETPRKQVPARSIGIANQYTGIYPTSTPGGWNLIARTPLPVFNPNCEHPCIFEIGAKVKFCPIPLEQYHEQCTRTGVEIDG